MKEIDNIDNIVLFVGDAVRYDYSRELLSDLGQTYKTIAGSLHTPASFGSILTGRNVPSHGITGFRSKLSEEVASLCHFSNINSAFSHKTGTMHKDLTRIFRHNQQVSLREVEEPFVWIVRDPGGHSPYNGYDSVTYEQVDETANEYFDRVAGDRSRIVDDYERGVENSVQRFRSAVEIIQDRGIEDRTLAIYTSDHGELLGEYGFLGHNHVACPELVYVPTSFVHPSISANESDKIIRHIDIFPTVLEVLGKTGAQSEIDGTAIQSEYPSIGYNHFEMVFYNTRVMDEVSLKIRSCWDATGGHSFVESSYLDSIILYLGILLMSKKGKHIIKTRLFRDALQVLLPGHTCHGNPSFNKQSATEYIMGISERVDNQQNSSLAEDTKQRLEDLGYI